MTKTIPHFHQVSNLKRKSKKKKKNTSKLHMHQNALLHRTALLQVTDTVVCQPKSSFPVPPRLVKRIFVLPIPTFDPRP